MATSTETTRIIYSMVRVSKSYDKKQVLTDITLGYYYGAKIGVLGLNGSGKSTLLRIMAGVDRDYEGQVIGELYLELAQQMPRIFQSPWAPEMHTAFQNLVITPVLQDQADVDAVFDELSVELERVKSL